MTPGLDGVRATVITVSDRCARGERPDLNGPLIREALEAMGLAVTATIIPDGAAEVEQALLHAIAAGARVVITTGGTGVTPRDLTPEGSAPVIERLLPGIAERIRALGIESAPASVLSRGLAGLTAGARPAFIANLPGSTGGVKDGLVVIVPLLPHLLDQLDGGDH